jgi:hypothetical protein
VTTKATGTEGGVRKGSRGIEAKKKNIGRSERYFISGRRRSILLEGSQVLLARPSEKHTIRVETLGRKVVKSWDRLRNSYFLLTYVEMIIWKV